MSTFCEQFLVVARALRCGSLAHSVGLLEAAHHYSLHDVLGSARTPVLPLMRSGLACQHSSSFHAEHGNSVLRLGPKLL